METLRENTVRIEKNSSLSLSDLRGLAAGGHEILYTPHVGNRWREDMYLARAGIRQALVSRNAAYVDEIDQPHHVRVAGENFVAASSGQHGTLTPFVQFDGPDAERVKSRFPQYASHGLARMHIESARHAIPGSYVVADRLLFLEDETSRKIGALLERLSGDTSYDVFSRRIEGARIIQNDRVRSSRDFQAWMDAVEHMLRNIESDRSDPVEGPIPSNAFAITATAVRNLLRRNEGRTTGADTDEAYCVSGPSMINYVKSLRTEIDHIYSQARKLFPELPETFTFHFVPGSVYDFVPAESETVMKEFVISLIDLERRMRDVSSMIGSASIERRKGLIDERKRLSQERSALRKEMLAVRARLPFLSQYDVLEGASLSDPDGLVDMPMADVRNIFHP